jgi:hypothetical protein
LERKKIFKRQKLKQRQFMPLKTANIHLVLVGLFLITTASQPCSVIKLTSNLELVSNADAVIRAKAIAYANAKPPADPNIFGMPDSRVQFKVVEMIRGLNVSEVILPGYLVDGDDFNDRQAPYTFVRPGGRMGNCFASSYRKGAEYLLFLKKTKMDDLTVNWAPLAPVNEQLHSSNDAWLIWVRQQAHQLHKASK